MNYCRSTTFVLGLGLLVHSFLVHSGGWWAELDGAASNCEC